MDVVTTTNHHCLHDQSGVINVKYKTHWNGILHSIWKQELDVQASRHHILSFWANNPAQPSEMRVIVAVHELAYTKSERHLSDSHQLVSDYVYRSRFHPAPLPTEASIG